MTYAYARVSSREQPPDRQAVSRLRFCYGVQKKNIYSDKKSGRRPARAKPRASSLRTAVEPEDLIAAGEEQIASRAAEAPAFRPGCVRIS